MQTPKKDCIYEVPLEKFKEPKKSECIEFLRFLNHSFFYSETYDTT